MRASSVIANIGYDSRTQTLEVEFHTGRVYQYFAVPAAVVEELRTADSMGRYFNQEIRPHYRSREITRHRQAG